MPSQSWTRIGFIYGLDWIGLGPVTIYYYYDIVHKLVPMGD